MTSSSCSEHVAAPAQRRLVVIEGMPGAGKTTTLSALERLGQLAVGEYVNGDGSTLAVSGHPGIADDDGHQANWLRKAARCKDLLRTGRVVYCDRDWLSSLAYACAACAAGGMLEQRAAWASRHLRESGLLMPACYIVFDLDPATSLARRAPRMRPGHPWTEPSTLRQLRAFYADPAGAVRAVDPGLAGILSSAHWLNVGGTDDPEETLHRVLAAGTCQ